MRQVGVLAASGIISLEKMTKRLHVDHENALYMAKALAEIPHVTVDIGKVHINIIFFEITNPMFDHDAFASYMQQKGIKINTGNNGVYRMVTHNDITRENIDYTLGAIKEALA